MGLERGHVGAQRPAGYNGNACRTSINQKVLQTILLIGDLELCEQKVPTPQTLQKAVVTHKYAHSIVYNTTGGELRAAVLRNDLLDIIDVAPNSICCLRRSLSLDLCR